MKQTAILRYEGPLQAMATLARLLQDEGPDVGFDGVFRRPSMVAQASPGEIVYFVCRGSAAAIHAAARRFRELAEPGTAVDVLGGTRSPGQLAGLPR